MRYNGGRGGENGVRARGGGKEGGRDSAEPACRSCSQAGPVRRRLATPSPLFHFCQPSHHSSTRGDCAACKHLTLMMHTPRRRPSGSIQHGPVRVSVGSREMFAA